MFESNFKNFIALKLCFLYFFSKKNIALVSLIIEVILGSTKESRNFSCLALPPFYPDFRISKN